MSDERRSERELGSVPGLSKSDDAPALWEWQRAREALAGFERGKGREVRAEDRSYCQTCGKLVAAVVVINARRWLYTVGGRIGSHGQNVDTLHAEVRQWRGRAEDAEDRGDHWLSERLADIAAEREQELERVSEAGERRVMGSNVVPLEVATRADFEQAPCRGCRRFVPITMDADKHVRHEAVNGGE